MEAFVDFKVAGGDLLEGPGIDYILVRYPWFSGS